MMEFMFDKALYSGKSCIIERMISGVLQGLSNLRSAYSSSARLRRLLNFIHKVLAIILLLDKYPDMSFLLLVLSTILEIRSSKKYRIF